VNSRRGHTFAAVYGRLRAAILDGELEAGEITTQMALAERFDVGRTPLREALRVLQKEGLVVNDPNRRVQITAHSVADVEQLYVARVMLESEAVRATVPQLTSRDDAELLGYLAQMDHYGGASDWIALRDPHRAFHHRLYSAAGERLIGLIAELAEHGERYRAANAASAELWEQRQAEHRAIAAAAGRRDPELSAQLLVEHYVRTAVMICADLEPEHDLRRLTATVARVAPGAERPLAAGTTRGEHPTAERSGGP
jgi:DNA-binding GntR family transcriptional regulator